MKTPLTLIRHNARAGRGQTFSVTVIGKFKNYKAKDIVDYMHEEKAYRETKPGDIIPFSLAKEI